MRQKMKFLALTALISGLFTANAFSQTAPEDPSQLGSRQIEVRTLDVNYDTAYRSATQALLSIGYAINHSDKTSGILTGTRAVGVKWGVRSHSFIGSFVYAVFLKRTTSTDRRDAGFRLDAASSSKDL